MQYKLIRSKRKSLSLSVQDDLSLVVRAPKWVPKYEISAFVEKHKDWIVEQKEKIEQHQKTYPALDEKEKEKYIALAKQYIPQRVAHFAKIMQVSPQNVKITSAKKRFGSCSYKNSLCFAWRLMRYPKDAIDYVVVHELSHITHKNHGKAFYQQIESVLPDYKAARALLYP